MRQTVFIGIWIAVPEEDPKKAYNKLMEGIRALKMGGVISYFESDVYAVQDIPDDGADGVPDDISDDARRSTAELL